MSDPILDRLLVLEDKIQELQTVPRTRPGKIGPSFSNFAVLPGLRALWYPGSMDQAGSIYDQSGQGRTLTYAGNPALRLTSTFVPFLRFDGVGDWMSRADEVGLRTLGTETSIVSSQRGCTMGGWFRFSTPSSPSTTIYDLMSKNAAGANRGPRLFNNGASGLTFNVSNTGAAVSDSITGIVPTVDTWYFIVGRFTTSTDISLFVNGTKTTAATATASLFAVTAPYAIGVLGNLAANPYVGDWALGFLCGAALLDAHITKLFNVTRSLFGV